MDDYDAFPMPPGPQHSLYAPAVPQLSQLPAQMQAHQQQQHQHQQQALQQQQQQAPGPAVPRALRMPPAVRGAVARPARAAAAGAERARVPDARAGAGPGLMAAAQAQAQGLLPAAWQLAPELIADFERFQVALLPAPVSAHAGR
jgi:hypothetical protein